MLSHKICKPSLLFTDFKGRVDESGNFEEKLFFKMKAKVLL
jgi:hypothetical protein